MRYGKEVYSVGDCLYLPEGAYYGPITPVAVKDGGTENMHFVDIQFEGPSGIPYPDPEAVINAQRALAKRGTFEEGIYTPESGRKRDAYEAILEELTGEPVNYPPSRLDTYVVMRHGHIVEAGRTSDVLSRPSTDYTATLLKAARAASLERL